MTKYSFPKFPKERIIYKGKRFMAVVTEVQSENPIQGDKFVVWDGLYDAELSNGIRQFTGECVGELSFSHVPIEVPAAESISRFVKNSAIAQERYFKACGN